MFKVLKNVKQSVRSWVRNNTDEKATTMGFALAQAAGLLPPKHAPKATKE